MSDESDESVETDESDVSSDDDVRYTLGEYAETDGSDVSSRSSYSRACLVVTFPNCNSSSV